MASSFGFMGPLSKIAKPVLLPVATASLAYGAYNGRGAMIDYILAFATGPGRNSRLLALAIVLFNWKSLPFMWTVRDPRPLASLPSSQDRPGRHDRTVLTLGASRSASGTP